MALAEMFHRQPARNPEIPLTEFEAYSLKWKSLLDKKLKEAEKKNLFPRFHNSGHTAGMHLQFELKKQDDYYVLTYHSKNGGNPGTTHAIVVDPDGNVRYVEKKAEEHENGILTTSWREEKDPTKVILKTRVDRDIFDRTRPFDSRGKVNNSWKGNLPQPTSQILEAVRPAVK